MQSFTDVVRTTVERRFNELHVDAKPLTVVELKERFGRQQVSGAALHFEIGLEGTPCALTVTTLDERQADDYGAVRTVSEEVERLRASGRFVTYHQVIVAPRGTILLDLVGQVRTAMDARVEELAEHFLDKLLDHDTIRPLLR